MTDEKRPGRPRMYAGAAERTAVFRSRQADSGYLRREVLMTQENVDTVKALAKGAEVSFLDAASGLLEYGLTAYLAQNPRALAATASPALSLNGLQAASGYLGSVGQAAGTSSSGPPVSAPAVASTDDNPIKRFFKQRKETKNDE